MDYRPEPGEEGLRAVRAALRGHWSPLFLRLLGRWWRGLPLGHFQRSPGVVFDLARGQLALALDVLEREEPTSEPRPLPVSCTLYQEGSRLAGAQWCGWLEISPLLHGGLERGATAIRGTRGDQLMQTGAATDRPIGIDWGLLPLVPEHPEVQGQRRAESQACAPQPPAPASALNPAPLKPAH